MKYSRIVVANDDAAYLSLIKELLLDEGYRDVECIAGPTAFELIKQKQPDLVLLDINIKNADEGWKTLSFLRLHPDTTNIPMILCSTDGKMLREKADWLREMRCETLEKPFDIDTLLKVVGPPTEQADEAPKREERR